MTTVQGHRNPSSRGVWDADRVARTALADRAAAASWLRNPVAGGLRAATEVENARRWRAETGLPAEDHTPTLLAAWFAYAYEFAATAPGDHTELAPVAEMPMTGQWLAYRADRLDRAPVLVASPAAVATAIAAAQALTVADVETLTAAAANQPHPDAHLVLSAPIMCTATTLEETEAIHSLTWWHTDSGLRVIDWIATNGPAAGDDFTRAREAASRFGAALPPIVLNGERVLAAASARPAEDDLVYSEGQFTFDEIVYDPDRDLLPRIVLVLRHLIGSGELSCETVSVRPLSSTGHVNRADVTIVRAANDVDHTGALLGPGTTTTIRRQRSRADLQWTAAQWSTETPRHS
ncbi:hypothetical protein [Prescottella agglutinans]|uniref:Uncharacterized protein n=1 Tax=Prescottella agglutinans TaxID=1644129 RepID=A0ABT6MIY0_9NOCA|nr:hypothetical protein [Prescottella agglutinans]MDH6284278.1 hypothetical protein [Prescottella agglutinans]